MRVMRSLLVPLFCLGLSPACTGRITEVLAPKAADALVVTTPLEVSVLPSFADERGGGLFIDLAGRVVRARSDGTRAPLESHPSNNVVPGPASALWPLGPFNALVVTSKGLFIADSGWLIEPAWRSVLSAEGVVATSVTDDGVTWLAHSSGLFQIEGGTLRELKVKGESIAGLTAVAPGLTPSGRRGIWFAQGTSLSSAAPTETGSWVVQAADLTTEELAGGVKALAAISPSPTDTGEVWVATPKTLWLFSTQGWTNVTTANGPRQLMASGRTLWLQLGNQLFRRNLDDKKWVSIRGLEAPPSLMAADATGLLWARMGDKTVTIASGPAPRVSGLFQNARVYEPELPIRVTYPSNALPTELRFAFDDAAAPNVIDLKQGQPGPNATTIYSLAGVDVSNVMKPISLAALADGFHTLKIVAVNADMSTSERLVHFEFRGAANATVSFAGNIAAISETRCAKCHTTGTMPELASYSQWKANAENIAQVIRDRRMPADGPLDATQSALIQRWVSGGTAP